MNQLTEIGLTEEVVRPFARMTAHKVTQDDLQGLGCDVSETSSSSIWTIWFQNKLL